MGAPHPTDRKHSVLMSRVLMLRVRRMIAASAERSMVAVAVALAGTLVAACSTGGSATSNQQTNYVPVDGGGVIATYDVGHRALVPQIAGKDLAGNDFDLAQFAGKVIVLNFWASWCPPCRSEAPALEQVYTDTRSAGVQFVGIDIRENGVSDGAHFATAHKIDYPSIADQADRVALAFRGHVVPQSPPTTLVIDRSGHIAARGLGEMRYAQLVQVVRAVAGETT
jgi:thiol-disulfide isomerase/thioredoxin